MATRTLPAGECTMQRQSRYAPHRQREVTTYSPRCVAGSLRGKPKMVLKPERPLVPPRFMALRLKVSQAQRARAWVMIEKYTPRIRLRKVRKPKMRATTPGTMTTANKVKAAL